MTFPIIYGVRRFYVNVELLYDVIPVGTEKLEIVLDTFNGYQKVNQQIPLEVDRYQVGDMWIGIQDIEQDEKETRITIASDFQVLFDEVTLQTVNGAVPLQTTGDFNDQTKKWIRTLYFPSADEAQTLEIGGILYKNLWR